MHRVIAGIAAVVIGLGGIAAQSVSPPVPNQPLEGLDDIQLLELIATPRTVRDECADRLLDRVDDESVREALARALDPLGVNVQARGSVLRAIARRPVAPAEVWPMVAAMAYGAGAAELPDALAAVASFRTRAAAQLLVGFCTDEQPPAVRDAAFSALTRLSGRSDIPAEHAAWSAWYIDMLSLSERQWQQALIRGLAARNDGLKRERLALTARLVDAQRTLWLATPAAQRSTFLAGLLRDDAEDLRRLGIDLVRQQVALGEPLEPVVGEAAIGLLSHPKPSIRADGARLINQLAPPDAGAAVLAALERETDPRAAEQLLAASRRWPTPEARGPILQWLERGGAASSAAADACLALQREGLLTSEDQVRVLEVLRSLEESSLQAPAVKLFVTLGDASDLARVASLMTGGNRAVRLAAAEALIILPDYADDIAHAARADPALFDAAGRAMRAHHPNAEGLAALAESAQPAEPGHSVSSAARQAISSLARDAELDDILLFTDRRDLAPPIREAILSELLTRRAMVTDADAEAYHRGLVELARVRIALMQPEAALAAISALTQDLSEDLPPDVADVRATALVLSGSLAEASNAPGSPGSWMDAIDIMAAEDDPAAPVVAEHFATRFGLMRLTAAERDRYIRLCRQLGVVPSATLLETSENTASSLGEVRDPG